jgi:hypothetical protein
MCKTIVVANEVNCAEKMLYDPIRALGVEVVSWVRLDQFLNGYAVPDGVNVVVFNEIGANQQLKKVADKAKPLPVVSVTAKSKVKGGGVNISGLKAWADGYNQRKQQASHIEVAEPDHRPPPTAIVKVPFRDSHIDAVKDERGIWAGVRRMCEDMGLGYASQTQKLHGADWATVTNIVTVDQAGRAYEMLMLRADCIPMWMANINPAKVAPEIRPAIEAYQLKARDVLAAYFTPVAAHAAGVDVEAIGAALMQTGKELKQLRSEVEDLRFTIGALKPALPTWTELVPLEVTVQDVYAAIEECGAAALRQFGLADTSPNWYVGLLRAKEHVNVTVRKAVFTKPTKKKVSGRFDKMDAYAWRAIINVCKEPRIIDATAAWLADRHHRLLA